VAALWAALVTMLLTSVTLAQDVATTSLKAAYIYQFALFTQWPPDALPQAEPLTMCVVGDANVREALERTVKNATIGGRRVTVAFGQPDKPPTGCHALYVSAVSSAQAARLVAGLREMPVLTISDLEGFNKMGGIVEFVYEGGQLRFSIRSEAVTQSHLQLSSKLLSLARAPR
jgi:hypothetical protein